MVIRRILWLQCLGFFWFVHANLAMVASFRVFVMLHWCYRCCDRRIWRQEEENEEEENLKKCKRSACTNGRASYRGGGFGGRTLGSTYVRSLPAVRCLNAKGSPLRMSIA